MPIPSSAPNSSAFARLNTYVSALPQGLASYPSCTAKASIYRHALSDKPLDRFVGALPSELAALLREPMPVSAWVPSPLVQALFIAIADAYEMEDDRFQSWSQRLQSNLLRGPLYRALALVASPGVMLAGAQLKWRNFHRGSDVKIERQGPKHGLVRLRHPPNLFARTNLYGFAGGLNAVATLSQARESQVKLVDMSPMEASFAFSWA